MSLYICPKCGNREEFNDRPRRSKRQGPEPLKCCWFCKSKGEGLITVVKIEEENKKEDGKT